MITQSQGSTDKLTVIEVLNPATGALVGAVPVHDDLAVTSMSRELRAHQTEWDDLGPRGRKPWLRAFQDWIIDNTRHLVDIVASESGKARTEARIEPPMCIDMLNYWAGNAEKFLADQHPGAHSPLGLAKRLTTTYRSYPLVGVITPWNFPLAMPGADLIPALAAGAAVLLKPSEVTPLSAVELARGWAEIGAPRVFRVATGPGSTGAAVVANADYVQFTGSTTTGRAIARSCADRLIPCGLELGGKDAAIVLADADLDRAANGITWGGLFNAGQTCISVERVYVEAPVYDVFVEKLTRSVAGLRQGHEDSGCRFDVGAMATTAQRDLVKRHVDDAVASGARITTGGQSGCGTGTFFEPTVLVDAEQSMTCMTDETFGPTLPVMKVADENEAIRLANDSRYGLSASVWTSDLARGERVARQLQVGAVNINDVLANLFALALPMGGWKNSGIGARLGGASGLLKYCRQQAITAPRLRPSDRELLWYPYSERKFTLALGVIRASAAKGLRRFGLRPRNIRHDNLASNQCGR